MFIPFISLTYHFFFSDLQLYRALSVALVPIVAPMSQVSTEKHSVRSMTELFLAQISLFCLPYSVLFMLLML